MIIHKKCYVKLNIKLRHKKFKKRMRCALTNNVKLRLNFRQNCSTC